MEKHLLAIVVVFLFCLLYTAAIVAQTKGAAKDGKAGINIAVPEPDTRTLVQNFGFGKRISVKLKDGSKVGGRITGLAANRFVITNSKGVPTSIDYAGVSRISKQKEKLGMFHRPWVAVMFTAAGIGTLIMLTLAWLD